MISESCEASRLSGFSEKQEFHHLDYQVKQENWPTL